MYLSPAQKASVYRSMESQVSIVHTLSMVPNIELELKRMRLLIEYGDIYHIVLANIQDGHVAYIRPILDKVGLKEKSLERYCTDYGVKEDIMGAVYEYPDVDELVLLYALNPLRGKRQRPQIDLCYFGSISEVCFNTYGDMLNQIPPQCIHQAIEG